MEKMEKMESITLTKFSKETGTCSGLNSFMDGFFGQFQDSFCYTFYLQFLIVTLLYLNVGKGKYWKILFYASIAGVIGAFIENATVAYICSTEDKQKFVVTFFINEIFWISNEYAIPILNLIKMKAFAKGSLANITKYVIMGLAIPFIIFRLGIGYYRMSRGYLRDEDINAFHGYAFAVMAVADLICTVAILYFVRVYNSRVAIKTSNINHFIKQSSYTILIIVDVVSVFLSITNILSNVGPYKNKFSGKLFTPLHCLKCSFILILAIDAFIFKYDANVSSQNESSGNTRTYGAGTESYNNYYNNNASKNSSYKTRINNLNSSDSKNKSTIVNVSPYNYYDNDYPKPESATMSNSKSIVKNYAINTNLHNDNNQYDVKIYSPQKFGFLSHVQ